MLQDLTPASFEAHLGTTFRIHYGGETPLEVVLFEVVPHERHSGPREQPFTARFRGPRQPILTQQIYKIEHSPMGTMDIFIVPIGPDAQGMRYEAVFN